MPRTALAAICTLTATLTSFADAQSVAGSGVPRYTVLVISPGTAVASAGPISQSLGLNNNGRVVGYVYTAALQYKALNWKSGSAMQLGGLSAFDQTFANRVNLLGRVAGVGYKMNAGGGITETHALKWTGGVMSDLGTLGGHHAAALAINDFDQIVGGSSLAGDTITRAFIYSNGVMTAISTLPGAVESYAYDISNTGYVVGTAVTATAAKPFIWHAGATALPVPSGVRAGAANAVNDSGIAAGTYELNQYSGSFAAVMWVNGQLVHLGNLGGGLAYAVASDINSANQVVGTSNSPAGFTGFVWKSGVMYDLRALIAPAYGPVAITSAGAINDSGQIAAVATINGRQTAVLLTPTN